MSVHRAAHRENFTIMSNYHLRDEHLSLKAKGLLSQLLSLPPEWDYTLAGLAHINKEGKDAIRSGLRELERYGYVVRSQSTDTEGCFSSNIYEIYEQPSLNPHFHIPLTGTPLSGKPTQ